MLGLAALAEAQFGAADASLGTEEAVGAVLIGSAVLIAAWSPAASVAVMALALSVPVLATAGLPGFGGVHLIASMLVVGYAAFRMSLRSGLWAYAVSVLVPALTIVARGEEPYEFIFYSLVLGPAWAVGSLLRRERGRSLQLQQLAAELRSEREQRAHVAVAAERTRISRELHDAVAHNVSVMTLQVGVVRRRLEARTDLAEEAQTLTQAEGSGRQAVDELRRIVGLVRGDEDESLSPLPSLGRIDELVRPVRATGAQVDVTVRGDVSTVPDAVDISAFRILQEAVTNCLRHAPGSRVRILVDVRSSEVALRVSDRGSSAGPRPRRPAGTGGYGLVTMRERATALGGTLSAGMGDEGFVVSATLPTTLPTSLARPLVDPVGTDAS